MKALIYLGEGAVSWTDVPTPQPSEGEDIVAVLTAGICGTDLGAVRNGRPPIPEGMTIGHEFVGRRMRDGAYVVANPILSCGQCRACQERRPHLCEKRQVLGVHRPGAFAERISVPKSNLTEVGDLDRNKAAMIEPIATALHAWRLSPMPRENVAVFGAGPIGMSLLHVLKANGVENITVTDISSVRRDFARNCGAAVSAQTADGSYEATFDTVGAVATRRNAIENVRSGGTAVLVGLHAPELAVGGGSIIAGERTIRGSFAYTPEEFTEAVDLADSLDTRWISAVPFEESAEVFSKLVSGQADPANVKVHLTIAN
jgi:threonine dehydrogenase-like Zn-dependent dehydrogenase